MRNQQDCQLNGASGDIRSENLQATSSRWSHSKIEKAGIGPDDQFSYIAREREQTSRLGSRAAGRLESNEVMNAAIRDALQALAAAS